MTTTTQSKPIPGPTGGFKLGLSLRSEGPATLTRLCETYGDVVGFAIGRRRIVLLNRPEYAHHVLVGSAQKYGKSSGAKKVKSLLGEGLLTAEGELWKKNRSLIQPMFSNTEIRRQVPLITQVLHDALERWLAPVEAGASHAVIDLHGELMRVTLTVAARALFSSDLDAHLEVFRQAFGDAFEHVVKRLHTLIDLPPEIFPTPANLKFRRAVGSLDRVVGEIVETRRRSNAAGRAPSGGCPMGRDRDLLGHLLAATRGEDGTAALSEKQLRDEILTLILGGYDTAANSLTWAFYLLSQHPEALAKVRAEADAVFADGPPDADAVQHLSYSRMVFEEAMRLYPPVWVLAREARVDDEIDGHAIPAGTMVLVSPFVLHRLPSAWTDPLAFRPERFSEAQRHQHPRSAYIPFGGGHRHCLGRVMALQEGTLAIAQLAHGFDFEPLDAGEPAFNASITLAPKGGYKLRVRRREPRRPEEGVEDTAAQEEVAAC